MIDHYLAWPCGTGDEAALRRREQLRGALIEVAALVGEAVPEETAEQAAARANAYVAAPPIARRRFDAVVGEASASAAAGIAALIRYRAATGRECPAAAERLVVAIGQALAAADRLAPPA